LDDITRPGFLSLQVGSNIVYASKNNVVGSDLIVSSKVQSALGEIEDAVLFKLDDLVLAKLASKEEITAELLGKEVPELDAAKAASIADLSHADAERVAQAIDDLAAGLSMSKENINKVLFGLPNR
jgi:hypothetical protein